MNRRDLIKTSTGVVLSASVLPFLKVSEALAQSSDTAVVVIGNTINSLDIHRSGTNRPSYQVAAMCTTGS